VLANAERVLQALATQMTLALERQALAVNGVER
jgi:hypothetical protein